MRGLSASSSRTYCHSWRQTSGATLMTVPRVLLLLVAGVLFADYRFGDGRLIDTLSAQATQLVYKLNDEVSRLERRVAPSH
jgi:hypothetical protein